MPSVHRIPGATADAPPGPALSRASLPCGLLLLAILSLVSASPAPGAILVDAASSARDSSTSTLAWSHTVGAGADRVLVVGVSTRQGNRVVTGVTFGGLPLALVGTQTDGLSVVRATLFILVAPPSGTANVAITLSGQADVVAGAVSFSGVYQASPVAGFLSAGGSGLLASVAVACAAGEVVVDTVAVQGSPLGIAAGGGQTQQWNLGTGVGGNDVIGGGSTEPGAASVTMSWSLGAARPWAIGAARLRPASVVPDALIKLASEGVGAYLSGNVYENPAVTQVKSAGVMSGTTAVYDVLIENDGNVTGDIRVTGTPGAAGFTVRYLDETSTDRTGAVTGAGYVIAGLPAGGSRNWTLEVTPSGSPAPVPGSTAFNVFVTAVSVADPTFSDQVEAVTSSTSANLTMLKSADKANARPGEDVTYSITVSNGTGLSSASAIAVTEPVPTNTGYKVGSANFAPGASTLTAALSWSSDGGATWSYPPASGGCGAPSGYDYCVTHVRWTMSGSMPTGTSFGVGLTVRIR